MYFYPNFHGGGCLKQLCSAGLCFNDPSIDAAGMPSRMNAFEFAARMWRGAPAMVLMQEDQLGEFINLTGEELADLVAFVHDADEQEELSTDQVPERFMKMINP